MKHCALSKEWRRKNPEKYRAQIDRSNAAYRTTKQAQVIFYKYSITMDQYYSALAEQDGKCKLCHEPFMDSKGRRPVVDHDHETGSFRGILHSNCNLGLGMFRDNPEVCAKAEQYLKSWRALLAGGSVTSRTPDSGQRNLQQVAFIKEGTHD